MCSKVSRCQIRDDTYITSMKIVEFSGPPPPIVHLRPKFFHLLEFSRPNLVEHFIFVLHPPPPSPPPSKYTSYVYHL